MDFGCFHFAIVLLFLPSSATKVPSLPLCLPFCGVRGVCLILTLFYWERYRNVGRGTASEISETKFHRRVRESASPSSIYDFNNNNRVRDLHLHQHDSERQTHRNKTPLQHDSHFFQNGNDNEVKSNSQKYEKSLLLVQHRPAKRTFSFTSSKMR